MGYVAAPDGRRRFELEHPGRRRPDQPGPRHILPGRRPAVANGKFTFTETNAYSGNNGRAAILRPRSTGSTTSTRRATPATGRTRSPKGSSSAPARRSSRRRTCPRPSRTRAPTPVGSFNVTQLGDKADKVGKDDNFRGLTIYNNVLYYTKGSGGNGVDTVYFVDTTGKACPNGRRPACGRARRCRPRAIAAPVHAADRPGQQPVRPEGLPDRVAKTPPTPATTRSGSGSPARPRCTSPTRAPATTRRRMARTPRPPRPPRPACRSGSTTHRQASGSWPTCCRTG